MKWFKKRSLQDIEKDLIRAKAEYSIYESTFKCQAGFSENQRKNLMNLKASRDLLEYELNTMKFKEVVDGTNGGQVVK